MAEQIDLEDYLRALPQNTEKLFKRPGTSSRAASGAAKYAGKTFLLILEALSARPMTPDEVAQATGINLLTARPRMSDLANPRDENGHRIAPFIVATGQERSTGSGKAAAVMRLTTPTERREWRANTN